MENKRNRARRAYIPEYVKRHVFTRDGHKCKVCGKTDKLHLDHIKPYIDGGSSEVDNLQVLCYKCNGHKGKNILSEESFDKGYPIIIKPDNIMVHFRGLPEIPGYNGRHFLIVTPTSHDLESFINLLYTLEFEHVYRLREIALGELDTIYRLRQTKRETLVDDGEPLPSIYDEGYALSVYRNTHVAPITPILYRDDSIYYLGNPSVLSKSCELFNWRSDYVEKDTYYSN